jgi:predicted  nucleic acid-binding Zn-ribbon protein
MPDEDLLRVLTRFHQEVLVPDIERIFEERLAPFRGEVLSHFDAIYRRFDRLEDESVALKGGLLRLEERMAALENRMAALEVGMGAVGQKLERMALRSELLELKEQVAALDQRIAQLEAAL